MGHNRRRRPPGPLGRNLHPGAQQLAGPERRGAAGGELVSFEEPAPACYSERPLLAGHHAALSDRPPAAVARRPAVHPARPGPEIPGIAGGFEAGQRQQKREPAGELDFGREPRPPGRLPPLRLHGNRHSAEDLRIRALPAERSPGPQIARRGEPAADAEAAGKARLAFMT